MYSFEGEKKEHKAENDGIKAAVEMKEHVCKNVLGAREKFIKERYTEIYKERKR